MQLALGTVQFGLAYGVAGRQTPVEPAEAARILAYAFDSGVRRLDTAPGYGDIEGRLLDLCGRRPFEIVSKIPLIPDSVADDALAQFVHRSVETSCAALGDRLCGIIFHDPAAVAGDRGAIAWDAARTATTQAGVKLGISRYAPDADTVCGSIPDMVQLPGSALDQRVAGWTPPAATEVSLRSAFLQGLLVMPLERAAARLPRAGPALRAWHAWCHLRGLAPARAALSVVKAFAAVDYCLIGVDSLAQLKDVVEHWDAALPVAAPYLASDDLELVDPRRWALAA